MIDRRIQYEDKWNRDDGDTLMYFNAPRDMLGSQYPEAESATLCVEFPTDRPYVHNAVVSISPCRWFEDEESFSDYDWNDIDLPDEEIAELMTLADKRFVNTIDGAEMSQAEFVDYVFEEAERQFNECHENERWEDLTEEEKAEIFRDQYDHQLNDRDWVEKVPAASLDEKIAAVLSGGEGSRDNNSSRDNNKNVFVFSPKGYLSAGRALQSSGQKSLSWINDGYACRLEQGDGEDIYYDLHLTGAGVTVMYGEEVKLIETKGDLAVISLDEGSDPVSISKSFFENNFAAGRSIVRETEDREKVFEVEREI